MALPAHSPVGGSGMHRWQLSACPGSVHAEAEAGINESGFAAQEGTAVHELCEVALNHNMPAAAFIGKTYVGITITKEMADYGQGYIDFVRWQRGTHYVEYQFHCPEIHPLCHSTLDHSAVSLSERTLRLTDLKYGRVAVEAEGNPQLKYYAVGIIQSLGLWTQIDHIVANIYQPRLWDGDGPVKTTTFSIDELRTWAVEVLQPSIISALTPFAPRKVGNHCRYCIAKLTCSTFMTSAKSVLGFTQPLSNEDLALVLTMAKSMEDLARHAQKESLSRLMAGKQIPGYKPVRKYGRSKVTNPEACAIELINLGHSRDDIYETKLKGITELKALKGAKGIVTRHAKSDPMGETVVPLSNPKPAVPLVTEQFPNPFK